MSHPDQLSARVVQPITDEEAEFLLADDDLRRECERRSVELPTLVDHLRLAGEQRLRRADAQSTHRSFFRWLDELARHDIRFVLIGGLAGRIYGSTWETDDFDICHARDPENLDRLARLLRSHDAEFRRLPANAPAELSAEVFLTETDFVFCTPLGKFDLIGEFTGVGRYEQAQTGAIAVRLGRNRVRVLSLTKLLAAKKSTGREKDLRVHDELQVVRLARRMLDRSSAKAG